MAALIVLVFMGVVLWFAFSRPSLRTGGWSGRRVYLRRGPGLGGVALAVIAFIYLAEHVSTILYLLLIIVGVVTVLLALYGGARRLSNRGK